MDTVTKIAYSAGNGLFGGYDVITFLTCMFFAIIGHLLVTTFDVATRDVHKAGTPTQFSWQVYITDNWKRGVRNVLLIYVCVRFFPELYTKPLSDWGAFLAGLSIDAIFLAIKKARRSWLKS